MYLTRHFFAGLAAILTAALGLLALGIWQFGDWHMVAFGSQSIPMAPSTALLFAVMGLALAARLCRPGARMAEPTALAGAALVALTAALEIMRSWLGFPLPWDGWFLDGSVYLVAIPVGRMAPITAVTFLCAAMALAASGAWLGPRLAARWVAFIATVVGLFIGVVEALGYAAGLPMAYGSDTVPMALLTALAFIVLNLGLLLAGGFGALVANWLHPREVTALATDRRFFRVMTAVTSVLLLLIALAGFLYVRSEQEAVRVQVFKKLDAIAGLKAEQITQWRQERLAEAHFLMRAPAVATDIAALLDRPDDPVARAAVVGWLDSIKAGDRYDAVMLFDAQAGLRLAIPEAAGRDVTASRDQILAALSGTEVSYVDLHLAGEDRQVRFNLLAPIRPLRVAVGGSNAPLALILFRLNPAAYLYPLIQRWPVHSDTAESLLVRRDGDEVVYLSDLRHQPDAALVWRHPVQARDLPAARVVRGETGVLSGLDYRDTAVLVASRAIPESPWFLITKMDETEAYAPIRKEMWQTGIMVGLLLLAAVLGAAFVWRQRHLGMLQRVWQAERDQRALTDRLALLTRHANDSILLLDGSLRILEANEHAVATYGYNLEEFQQLPPGGLRAEGFGEGFAQQMDQLLSPEGIRFETVHRRKDGSTFPVEVSGRGFELDGRPHVLGIFRDLTERKVLEAERERLVRLYATLSQVNQAIVHAADRDTLLHEVCRVVVEYGRFRLAWIGWADFDSGVVELLASHGDKAERLGSIKVRCDDTPEGSGPTGRALRENTTQVCRDLLEEARLAPWREAIRETGLNASISLPIRLDGTVCAVLSVYADKPDFFRRREIELLEEAAQDVGFGLANLQHEEHRRQIEAALQENEERLRLALTASGQGLFDLDIRTGEAVVSPEYATMLGYDPATFRETSTAWNERLHPDDYEEVTAAYRDYVAGRSSDYRVEFRQRTKAGGWKWIMSLGQIVGRSADGQPWRMLGTHTDITERKLAEATLAASEIRYRRLFESAKDGILILDFETGMVVDVNPFLTGLLGFSHEEFLGKTVWELGFFRDLIANRDSFVELQRQEYILYEDKPLQTLGGRRIEVEFISNVYQVDGKKVIQCNIRDITARMEAEVALRAALQEKEALLKEVHHRVKNNLQVITSLLRLEAGRNKDTVAHAVLREMQGRILAMALLHETLYRTKNFARVDLAGYLREVATRLFRAQNLAPGAVRLVEDLVSTEVEFDQAIPCGLIVNELLTNALKHAFPAGRPGEVRVGLQREKDGRVRLQVSDEGVGLPAGFSLESAPSLGLRLVSDLIKQLQGELIIGPGPGTSFSIVFKPKTGSRQPFAGK